MAENKRLILPGFLSHDACKELEFIHKSCSTVGYRPHVFSTTLAHLIATNSAYLIMPFIPIRERLKEAIEDFFGCQYELSVEFTGLISWTKGASIGWHSDDNRPYLKQRHYAAVCYLNNYGEDFKGGLFHFQEGEPNTIVPKIGDAILYTADECNVHCVDEITDGERCTLTLWFTRDSAHNEDAKLINQISDRLYMYMNIRMDEDSNSDSFLASQVKGFMLPDSHSEMVEELSLSENVGNLKPFGNLNHSSYSIARDWLPLPASSNMYWVNPEDLTSEETYDPLVNSRYNTLQEQSGFDIRWARLSLLGFELHFEKAWNNLKEREASMQPTNNDLITYSIDALHQPLGLKSFGIELPELFINSLHALQVVQFYHWKVHKQSCYCINEDDRNVSEAEAFREASARYQDSQIQESNRSKQLLSEKSDMQKRQLATFNMDSCIVSIEEKHKFRSEDFVQACCDWKHYVCTLIRALLTSFPHWKANDMIFPVPS